MPKTKGRKWADFDEDDYRAELLSDIQKFLMFGLHSQDKRGHSESIGFRIEPKVGALLGRMWEKAPPGWFESRSELYRCALVGGVRMLMELVDPDHIDKKMESVYRVMNVMNDLSKNHKWESIEKWVDQVETEILKHPTESQQSMRRSVNWCRRNMARIMDDQPIEEGIL
jgi:hypothetical protein